MKEQLEQKIWQAIEALQQAGTLASFVIPAIRVERPKDEQFGEYTTSIALVLSKLAGKNPLETAEEIAVSIKKQGAGEEKVFEKVEVVKPGHINFYFSQKTLSAGVADILKQGNDFGQSTLGKGVKVNNEFISANPTGPLHLGNARGGFYADSLANILRKTGHEVVNEYYVNDAGEQVIKLGHSVLKDEEAVYGGEYIDELALKFAGAGDAEAVGKVSATYVLDEMIKKTLQEKMQIVFDTFVSERTDVLEAGYTEKAINLLKEKDLTLEAEGALWLRTTEFGDDKDRVLVKQDGTKTYFASDCGYILYKMERGFTQIIETWGADHHGYITRFRAAAQALGLQTTPRFIIVQLVKLAKNGVEVRMSKRAGNVVTIDDLIERVGHDVARFFFLMYAPETHMTFDLGLAEERSQKNPVFYVQYAHARLCSILRKAAEENLSYASADPVLLVHEKERMLIRELLFFPELIDTMAQDFSAHRLPQYAMRLADKLHSFYDACRVIDADRPELTSARLQLIQATRIVLAETLTLMGVAAPEQM